MELGRHWVTSLITNLSPFSPETRMNLPLSLDDWTIFMPLILFRSRFKQLSSLLDLYCIQACLKQICDSGPATPVWLVHVCVKLQYSGSTVYANASRFSLLLITYRLAAPTWSVWCCTWEATCLSTHWTGRGWRTASTWSQLSSTPRSWTSL